MDFKHPHNSQKKRSDWFDWWLSDEAPAPAAREEIRRFRVKQANTYKRRAPSAKQASRNAAAQPQSDGKNLVINLTMPKIRLPKFDFIKISTKNNQLNLKVTNPRALAITACTAVLAVVVLAHVFGHHAPSAASGNTEIAKASLGTPGTASLSGAQASNAQSPQAASTSAGKATAAKTAASGSKPKFTPVVPVTKPDLANSPFARSAYDDSSGIYTVMDTFKGAPVTINEQDLGSSDAKANQEAVKQNADQIKADQPITLGNGATAYVATNDQNHNQTAVLAVGKILIYVNSIATHSNSDWRDYLNLFQ
jgi:hypothetical protein